MRSEGFLCSKHICWLWRRLVQSRKKKGKKSFLAQKEIIFGKPAALSSTVKQARRHFPIDIVSGLVSLFYHHHPAQINPLMQFDACRVSFACRLSWLFSSCPSSCARSPKMMPKTISSTGFLGIEAEADLAKSNGTATAPSTAPSTAPTTVPSTILRLKLGLVRM